MFQVQGYDILLERVSKVAFLASRAMVYDNRESEEIGDGKDLQGQDSASMPGGCEDTVKDAAVSWTETDGTVFFRQ